MFFFSFILAKINSKSVKKLSFLFFGSKTDFWGIFQLYFQYIFKYFHLGLCHSADGRSRGPCAPPLPDRSLGPPGRLRSGRDTGFRVRFPVSGPVSGFRFRFRFPVSRKSGNPGNPGNSGNSGNPGNSGNLEIPEILEISEIPEISEISANFGNLKFQEISEIKRNFGNLNKFSEI